MEVKQLAAKIGFDECQVEEALRYGSYDRTYCDRLGINILDDQSDRPYNQQWNAAIIFEIQGDRYGYYKDGAQTVLDVLSRESTVQEWAKNWDEEHLPDLMAEVLSNA